MSDLSRLPISDKSDFQSVDFEDRLNHAVTGGDASGLIIHETSGSTGEVLRVARSTREETLYSGRRMRAYILNGLRPWHRRTHYSSGLRRLSAHKIGLFRVSPVSLDSSPDQAIATIERSRPDVLKGPPGALELLASTHPERLRALNLRLLFGGAEQVSAKGRSLIEEAAGRPLYDLYGAIECNLIAWQCGRCGLYHTPDDSSLVEILRDGRPALPGETGDVVITALHSFHMPIIRYRVGDVARRAADTGCGISFSSIQNIEGRIVDYLRFLDHPAISPYMIMNELDEIEPIRRYQVVQTSTSSVEIRVELAADAPRQSVLEEINRRSRLAIPPDVDIQTKPVERLVIAPAAKRRFVIALQP